MSIEVGSGGTPLGRQLDLWRARSFCERAGMDPDERRVLLAERFPELVTVATVCVEQMNMEPAIEAPVLPVQEPSLAPRQVRYGGSLAVAAAYNK